MMFAGPMSRLIRLDRSLPQTLANRPANLAVRRGRAAVYGHIGAVDETRIGAREEVMAPLFVRCGCASVS